MRLNCDHLRFLRTSTPHQCHSLHRTYGTTPLLFVGALSHPSPRIGSLHRLNAEPSLATHGALCTHAPSRIAITLGSPRVAVAMSTQCQASLNALEKRRIGVADIFIFRGGSYACFVPETSNDHGIGTVPSTFAIAKLSPCTNTSIHGSASPTFASRSERTRYQVFP